MTIDKFDLQSKLTARTSHLFSSILDERRLAKPGARCESDKLLAAIKTAKDKAGSPKVEVIQDDDLPEMEEHMPIAQ